MEAGAAFRSGQLGGHFKPLNWSARGDFTDIMEDASQKVHVCYSADNVSSKGDITAGWLKFALTRQRTTPPAPTRGKVRMRSEIYRFNEAFGLIVSDHLSTGPFVTEITGGDWIALQLRLTGCTVHQFTDRAEVWRGPSAIAYLLPDGYRMGFLSEHAQRIQAVTLMIRPGYLKRAFPELVPCLPRAMLVENPSAPCVGHHPLSGDLIKSVAGLLQLRPDAAYPRLLMHGKALELLVAALSGIGQSQLLPSVEPANRRYVKNLESARSIIDRNYVDPPPVEVLSRMVGLNRRTLGEGFKQLFGETVYQYCIRQRMDRALDLLLRERRTVTETAFEVGYADPASFSRTFKQFYGVQPGQAQRRV